MKAFQSALGVCDLLDVGYEAQWFTWERERLSHNNIRERLDRRVLTLGWENLFPSYSLKHCSHSVSDIVLFYLVLVVGWKGKNISIVIFGLRQLGSSKSHVKMRFVGFGSIQRDQFLTGFNRQGRV
ncbi:hypothetical protein Gohar_018784 [Gossypium harknessii]|uniref:Uncharacterized protein n=1 Tax=Gossypium harknessii TaxID=34285 RepID=A0A7J9GA55_9ROSI|nr:hypothetical protein [Gossypium harknessii]